MIKYNDKETFGMKEAMFAMACGELLEVATPDGWVEIHDENPQFFADGTYRVSQRKRNLLDRARETGLLRTFTLKELPTDKIEEIVNAVYSIPDLDFKKLRTMWEDKRDEINTREDKKTVKDETIMVGQLLDAFKDIDRSLPVLVRNVRCYVSPIKGCNVVYDDNHNGNSAIIDLIGF